jgi:Peptidase propeptide and YPEB domain
MAAVSTRLTRVKLCLALLAAWAPLLGLLPFVPLAAQAAGANGNQERIIDAVQKRFNARVVRVAQTQVNGRPALELRLLSEQRVWTIVVDAASGDVLSGG